MRIATWNMKQVAPRKSLEERWRWIEDEIAPDVIALTEAKVPDDGPPPGWTAIWVPGGDDELKVGDVAIVLVQSDSIDAVLALFAPGNGD